MNAPEPLTAVSADAITVGPPVCGIVMPISTLDNCTEAHWAEVLAIIIDSAEAAGFQGNLVSNADDAGIIQKRIIQNLYDNPIVVCDVSAKNPNVMFELGMRLAFDKPTIIIKDDKTSYSFDTSPIEHLEYPRDLRFSRIVDFKKKLAEKIKATLEKSQRDPQYTTFLKHFGEFKVAKIDQREVSGQEYIIDELRSLRTQISRLDRNASEKNNYDAGMRAKAARKYHIFRHPWTETQLDQLMDRLNSFPVEYQVERDDSGMTDLMVRTVPNSTSADPKISKIIADSMKSSIPE